MDYLDTGDNGFFLLMETDDLDYNNHKEHVLWDYRNETDTNDTQYVVFTSINHQDNNSVVQERDRIFNWTKNSSAYKYSIRISNTSSMDDVFLELDNITVSSGECTNDWLNTSDSASPWGYNYKENSTHCFFYLPYQFNITGYGYDYYQVRYYSL